MKVYRSIKDVKKIPSGSVAAIGVFDGLHRGHVHIVKTLVRRAKESNRKSLILTFYPNPFSKKAAPLLISLKHRIRLLEELGIDIVVVVKFNRNFSRLKPEVFVKDVLKKRLNVKEILAGDNFIFGWQGSGDMQLLKALSEKYDFKLRKINLLRVSPASGGNKRIISSTYIRSLIIKGRLKEASKLLGRPVSILGTVKKGTKRGRLLGYPTANIDPHHEAIPPSGVYAVHIRLGNKRYKRYRGILNIGVRPTFTSHPIRHPLRPIIEAHIFNFNKEIYGKDLEITFVKRLRPEKRFKDRDGLAKRIKLDEKRAKRILK